MVESMKTESSRRDPAAKRHRAAGHHPQLPAILRCYPRAWRERYGDELADMLAREPRSPRLAFDLALGALDAHLHPQVGERGPSRARRAVGVALLAGVLVGAGYLGQHPTTARTIGALTAFRSPSSIVATATPTAHGYSHHGARQE
jgi:hypothetical protein